MMNEPGRDGQPIQLTKPRGERGKRAPRNVNESVLESLMHKGLIGDAEYQAGIKYHNHLRKAASGASIPDVGRIPGKGSYDGDVMQCEAVIWLEKQNRDLSPMYRTVLSLALHPWSHMSLTDIDAAMKLPARKMRGRALLIEALEALAEILGFASRKNTHRGIG
jgi:hypothetical protein